MAETQTSKSQNSNGSVPIWLIIVIVLLIACFATATALLYKRPSAGSALPAGLPTGAAVAVAPSIIPSATGGPQGPTETPTWTPRASNTPYLTPTFVNTAAAPQTNTRAAEDISFQQNQIIIIGGSSGAPVVVPTVTQAIPRSTQTSVAATATQAITQTRAAGTATQAAATAAATATQAAATSTSAAASATPIPGIWRGDYYNNKDLQGSPALISDTPVQTLNNLNLLFNWGAGSPSPVINNDNFSARWRLNANFLGTDYLFYAFSDDGVRVFVDDGTVIDNWTNATNRVLYGTRSLAQGQHQVRVEYFESAGDARIAVGWQQVVKNAWVGEYYANGNLGEPPLYILQDNSINFNWGQGSPSALPSDNFSIRWNRNYDFGNAALYRFTVNVDDGVRLKVNNETIINEWHTVEAPTIYTVERQLSGTQNVTVEYFEGNGNAQIQLSILRIDSPTVTPTFTATPTATPSTTPSTTPTNTPTPP